MFFSNAALPVISCLIQAAAEEEISAKIGLKKKWPRTCDTCSPLKNKKKGALFSRDENKQH